MKIVIPNNDLLLSLVIILISIVTTAAGIFGTYAAAGKLGLMVVGAGWIAGFIKAIGGNFTIVGAFLLIGAVLIGPVVYDYHNNK